MIKNYIKQIELSDENGEREVVVTLNGNAQVRICPCCESWEQYGATTDEKYATVGIADLYNEWLHEGEKPDEYAVQREMDYIKGQYWKYLSR